LKAFEMNQPGGLRRRFTVAGALALAVGVTAAALVIGSNPGDPRRTVQISASDAVASVKRFVHDPSGLAVAGLRDGTTNRFYEVRSKTVEAAIDVNTGAVLSVMDATDMPTTSAVVLSSTDAAAAAAAFAAANGINVGGLTQTVELLDHGDTQEYAVTWTERVNGVLTPTSRSISVNPATGKVYAFSAFDRPYTAPPVPKLSESAAADAARAAVADTEARIDSTDLLIAFDASGAQHLDYQMHVTLSSGFFATVRVDAVTGAASVVTRG
jgi:hypothetical protein